MKSLTRVVHGRNLPDSARIHVRADGHSGDASDGRRDSVDHEEALTWILSLTYFNNPTRPRDPEPTKLLTTGDICCVVQIREYPSAGVDHQEGSGEHRGDTPSVIEHCLYIIICSNNQGRNHASKVGGPNRAKPDSRARGARDLRVKPESRTKPEKKRGGGVWGGGSVSLSPENFWNFELQIVQFGV